jgi:hypothetical protein
MSTYIVQQNLPVEIDIVVANPIEDSDLIYAGGGTFANGVALKKDNVVGEKNLHGGNPKLTPDEVPTYKKCDKVTVINETIKVESAPITRGLYKFSSTSDDKSDATYFWDEVYTSPIGYFTAASTSPLLAYEFSFSGNILSLITNDVNIVPKIGDYIVMQKLPTNYIKPFDINTSPTGNPELYSGIFSDGLSNMPVIFNTETYQLKIKDVTYLTPTNMGITYDYSFLMPSLTFGCRIYDVTINNNSIITSIDINVDFDGINPTGPGSIENLLNAFNAASIGTWTGTGDPTELNLYSALNPDIIIDINYQALDNTGTPTGSILQASKTVTTNPSVLIGVMTNYTMILDKSLSVSDGEEYAIVLLNRENTGLQKELFYDTFEQIEVQREQLLGDPYFETSTAKPQGRKNNLYYNNAQYLGIRNLLSGVLPNKDENFLNTPFIVYDIDEDFKDRFSPKGSTDASIEFEFHLPTVMLQEDTQDKLNILVNYGAVITDTGGAGQYSGLYLKWQQSLNKRLGFVFYDLRIIVIDDPELALALGYNSNRNYTLPRPEFTSPGNVAANITSSISLDIVGLQSSNTQPMVILVNGPHNLRDGDVISISDVRTKVLGSNLIHASNANGIRYIKRYYSDPANPATELLDRFYIYSDQALTASFPDDGDFVNSGIGQSGKVKGAKLKYNYFLTYRVKNGRYKSVLPYAELINFNFSSSSTAATIDNTSGAVYISLAPFTYLGNGYEIDDLEFIIGEWEAANAGKPFEITGFKNVVVMSSQDIIGPNSPSNVSTTNYTITKTNYTDFVARIGNPISYQYLITPLGNPEYNIYTNYPHYNIINGTLPTTLNTSEGKWTLGNIKYKTEVEQYRAKLQIVVAANEWNDTTNPSYDPDNDFIKSKYISEVAICDKDSDKPLIYTKIAPPVKKTGDLDLIINLTVDF